MHYNCILTGFCLFITAPISPPTNVISNGITSTTLDISWNSLQPEDENGIVRSYIINVTIADNGLNFEVTAYTNSVFLNDLHPYYTYMVSIAAFTVELGPFSIVTSYKTNEDGKFKCYSNNYKISVLIQNIDTCNKTHIACTLYCTCVFMWA